MIYCIYCQKDVVIRNGLSSCTSCKINYIESNAKLIWIEYNIGEDYYIDTDFFNKKCWLVLTKGDMDIIELNYLPEINPQNAKYWVDKLLKLKAFS